MLRVAADGAVHAEMAAGLDEIVREGARRMLAAALEAEVEAYLGAHAGERDDAGRRLVVRNGRAKPRPVRHLIDTLTALQARGIGFRSLQE